tara:strand:- start:108 stop:362 length:255 start_codon:yes stop_codon:yes gene_type:complete
MIIPVRCFTCGKIIANKWKYYEAEVRRRKMTDDTLRKQTEESVININAEEIRKTPEGEVMDELGLKRYCCRKMMLGHIELIDVI